MPSMLARNVSWSPAPSVGVRSERTSASAGGRSESAPTEGARSNGLALVAAERGLRG